MKSVRLDISNDNIYFDTQTLKYMRSTESVVSVEETGDSILRYEFAKSSQLKKLVILVTNCCNMSCRYCIADEGLYTQNKCRAFFDKELIIGKIRELFKVYPDGIQYIQLFGGEPLLAYFDLQNFIDSIIKVCESDNKPMPNFSMVTNGTLINKETVDFISKNRIYTTISLDGTEVFHNANRIYKNGRGTYHDIIDNIKRLEPKHLTVEFSVSNVLIKSYKKGMINDILIEYIDLGFRNYEQYPDNLRDIFDEYVSFMIKEINSENCRILDYALLNTYISVISKRVIRNTCTAGIGNLTITTDGKILNCYLSDNILDNGESFDYEGFIKKQKEYYEVDAPAVCRRCKWQRLCSGWCREMLNGDVYELKCIYIRKYTEAIVKDLFYSLVDVIKRRRIISNIRLFSENEGGWI